MKVIKKFLTLLSLMVAVSSFDANSQEQLSLNEDFLNSLPEDTRDQLLKQIDKDQKDLKDVDFGVISTMMGKTPAERFIEQELIKEKGKNIPTQYLRLDQLEIFGSDFFAGLKPSTFMPISEPSLSGEYMLDIGDQLEIDLIGSNATNSLETSIGQDGSFLIPGIGSLQVAGLTVNEATKKLQAFVEEKSPGVQPIMQLSEIRDMQVIVVGFVNNPGIYTLSGNSNILSSLRIAGGISNQGSFRNITIKRNAKVIKIFDLYDLLIGGNNSLELSLRSGDSVIVGPSGPKVAVYGGVSNPAIYEMTANETIQDAITYAGNGLNGANLNSVILSSIVKNNRDTFAINKEAFTQHNLSDKDQIFAPFVEEPIFNGIKLLGGFMRPGIYSIEELSSIPVIETSKDAYLNTFFLKRMNELSNTFSYEAVNPSSSISFKKGDTLIALTHAQIRFIQSKNFKDFIYNRLAPDLKACDLYSYLDEVRDSGRFIRSTALLISNSELSMLFGSKDTKDETVGLDESYLKNEIERESLFINKNESPKESSCPQLFNDDPELILAILQNSILIDGPSVQGGIFPIYSGLPLSQLFDRLSFFTPISGNEILSITNNTSSTSISINDIRDQNISLELGSNITIASKKSLNSSKVTITGEVGMPGSYYISNGDRLSNLINRAGGYTSNAFPIGGHLSRASAKSFEKDYNERLYNEIIKNLSSEIVKGGVVPYQTISYILNEFRSIKPSGRVIAEFNLPVLSRDISKDIILEDGDNIHIPKKSNIVYVFGEVLNPGPQVYSSDSSVNDYIDSAGGYTRLVDKGSVILVYPDGRSKLVRSSFLFSDNTIIPGSVIYASRDVRKLDNLSLASTLAPIVSSIAISLASLNSISNN